MSDIDSLIRERMAAAGAFDVMADPRRVRESIARRQRRIRRRRRAIVLLGVLTAAGVVVGVLRVVDQDSGGDVVVRTTEASAAPSDDTDARTESRPSFQTAPGWDTVAAASVATAANVPLGPFTQSGSFPPWDTVERLTEGDVVLAVGFGPTGENTAVDANYPSRELPLSLDEASAVTSIEGQPVHVTGLQLHAQVNGWNVNVLVFFGGGDPTSVPPVRSEPTAETRAAAQEQLARLVVPARP